MLKALDAINDRIEEVRELQSQAKEKKEKKSERVFLVEEISLLKCRLAILENLEYRRTKSNSTAK